MSESRHDGPPVSVVVPSYNHGRFLDACVGSVLGSDHDLELVVVDDGSQDDSVERLRAIDDPRLRLFVQENRGAHAALGRGLELSRGEVVFLLNSDDRFAADRIPKLVTALEDPSVVVATSWLEVIDGTGRRLGVKEAWRTLPPWPAPRSGPRLADLDDPRLALLETNFVSTTSNMAFRRRLLDAPGVGFAPLRYTHDWEFLLATARRGRVAVVPEPLVSYRVHGANTISEEGDGGSAGEQGPGAMRFEILWTVARHALPLLQQVAGEGKHPLDDLVARAWRSLPRFPTQGGGKPLDQDTLLAQLLAWRGEAPEPPPSFENLLEPGHPFRRAAVDRLDTL